MMTGKEQVSRSCSNLNPLLHKESSDNLCSKFVCLAVISEKDAHPTLQLGTVRSLAAKYYV